MPRPYRKMRDVSALHHHGACALVGEELHEDGMGDAAVHDDHIVDAVLQRLDAAVHLGDHAAGDDAVVIELFGLGNGDPGDQGAGVILVHQDAGDVGHHNEALGTQGTCQIGGGGVAVDVEGVALAVAGHGGDHGDVVLLQQVLDGLGAHLGDLANEAQALVLDLGLQDAAVDAGKSHGMAALHLDQVHQGLVDLARQDHLDDVHGLLVGDPQAVDEHGLLAQALHDLADLGAAAVDEDDLHADEPQQGDVLHDLLLQLLVDHGIAAVFDNDHLAVIAPDIRERLREYLRALAVRKIFFHISPLTCGSRR